VPGAGFRGQGPGRWPVADVRFLASTPLQRCIGADVVDGDGGCRPGRVGHALGDQHYGEPDAVDGLGPIAKLRCESFAAPAGRESRDPGLAVHCENEQPLGVRLCHREAIDDECDVNIATPLVGITAE
jgi:hypothetical protein